MNRTTTSRPVTATPRFDDKMYLSHYGLKRKRFKISPDRVFIGRGKNSRGVIRVVASMQGLIRQAISLNSRAVSSE